MSIYQKAQKHFAKLLRRLFRVEVTGADNEPKTGGFIVASNHLSYFDVIILSAVFKRQIRYMAKKELFRVPLLGRLITAFGAFPVDRKGSAVSSLKMSIKLLEGGECVGMFLQGHRFYGREVETTRSEVKGGVGMTAYHAKAPVVPVYIDTANNKVRMFRKTAIHIGEPIAFDEFGFVKGGAAEYERAALMIFDHIVELKHTAHSREVENG